MLADECRPGQREMTVVAAVDRSVAGARRKWPTSGVAIELRPRPHVLEERERVLAPSVTVIDTQGRLSEKLVLFRRYDDLLNLPPYDVD